MRSQEPQERRHDDLEARASPQTLLAAGSRAEAGVPVCSVPVRDSRGVHGSGMEQMFARNSRWLAEPTRTIAGDSKRALRSPSDFQLARTHLGPGLFSETHGVTQ